MEKTKTKKPPKIEVSDHPEFRVIHINTWAGGLSPTEGAISFFTDILDPMVKEDGKITLRRINRQRQIDIRMAVADFLRLAQWMNKHVKRLVDQGIIKKEEEVAKSKQKDYLS